MDRRGFIGGTTVLVAANALPGPARAAFVGAKRALLASQRRVTVPNDILAYWPLDDATISGNTVNDISNNGHAGTKTGTTKPSSATGQIKQGLLFDGSTGWINIPSIGVSIFPFAISTWFKTSDASAVFRTIVSAGSSLGNTDYFNLAMTNANKIRWQARGNNIDAIADGTTARNDGSWHHALGVSRGPIDHELFVDGTSVATASTAIAAPVTNQASIGSLNRSSNGSFFPGTIDDVRFYNRAITAGEAALIYAAGLGGRP